MRSFPTENGNATSQTFVVRDMDGTHRSTDRFVVDSYTGQDIQQYVGHRVMFNLHGRVSERDGRNYNNLYTREIILF